MGNKVEPIRDEKDIKSIKKLLQGNQRDYLLFVLGVNCGIRTGDLLKLKVKDMKGKKVGDTITIIEGKTKKQNFITINKSIHKAFQDYILHYQPGDDRFIFFSRKGKRHLTVDSVKRLIKGWCSDINLNENVGAHTLRKTFGYHQRVKYGVSIEILMNRFNHTTPATTRRYIGITDDEINNVCMNEI